jgi:hypothetical protein
MKGSPKVFKVIAAPGRRLQVATRSVKKEPSNFQCAKQPSAILNQPTVLQQCVTFLGDIQLEVKKKSASRAPSESSIIGKNIRPKIQFILLVYH